MFIITYVIGSVKRSSVYFFGKANRFIKKTPAKTLAAQGKEENMFNLTLSQVAKMLPKRRRDAQKGDFGRLLCITGCRNMPGACALSTQAALRSGAGLVTVGTAPENPMRLAAALPEAMWLPLETDADGFLQDAENHVKLLPHLKRANAVLLGCGMGTTEQIRSFVHWVLETATCPVILDADGLNCIAGSIDIDRRTGTDWILTPHPGEMSRLAGISVTAVQAEREKTASAFAAQYPVTLVLKGAGTLVAKDAKICRNPTGNPGMSRGGSGDVLAGMIAALAAQGLSSWDAACAGVYLHGMAGDIAAQKYSEQAMLPRDLIECLPEAFLQLEQMRESS